jgi:hypothetical protein
MRVRLTQIDGKIPNIALMKIARHHRERGDEIVFSKGTRRFPPPLSLEGGSAGGADLLQSVWLGGHTHPILYGRSPRCLTRSKLRSEEVGRKP